VKSSELLPAFLKRGVVVAGGLGNRKELYFRIGHMGITAIDTERGDVSRVIDVLRESSLRPRPNCELPVHVEVLSVTT